MSQRKAQPTMPFPESSPAPIQVAPVEAHAAAIEGVVNHTLSLQSAITKARFRISPFLALMFAVSILDRSNVGFAKNALKADAHIGDAAFAFGAGIFFIGYAIFEVPSNLMLQRVGAKVWLSRIMITWGIASALMMLTRGDLSFYALRFLVGLAEAGFSPGVVLYSTYWFPSSERGKALGIYYMGMPAALMAGGALSGYIMQVTNGALGLRNWQWMFIIEGMMASVAGVVAFFYLTSKPRDAKWLTNDERDALDRELAHEETSRSVHGPSGAFAALMSMRVLIFIVIYFTIQAANYAVIFYLPSRVAELAGTEINSRVGLLAAIPWLCAFVSLRIITGFADRTGKHRQFGIAMLLMGALGIAASTQTAGLGATLLMFCLAATGFVVVQPLFWTMPTAYLRGAVAASGIAVIGALGNLGGFVAPPLKTAAEQFFHNRNAGLLLLACSALVGVVLMITAGGHTLRAERGHL